MSLFEPRKNRARRNEIRADVRRRTPQASASLAAALREERTLLVLGVAVAFALCACAILMLRPRVIAYRPGQTPREDVLARVEFTLGDEQQLQRARVAARDAEPRLYQPAPANPLARLEQDLLDLPGRVRGLGLEQLDPPLRDVLDGATLTNLQEIAERQDPTWPQAVRRYARALREMNLVILPAVRRNEDWQKSIRLGNDGRLVAADQTFSPPASFDTLRPDRGAPPGPSPSPARVEMQAQLERRLQAPAADAFSAIIYPKVLAYTIATLGPTHVLDEAGTAKARQAAADRVPESAGHVEYKPHQTLVPAGKTITEGDWQLLRAEDAAFRAARLGRAAWLERLGLVGVALLMTGALSLYAWRFQPRVVHNPVRATGLGALLLGALLIAQLAGLGSGNLTLLGLAPVMLVAMTLCVAYDGRFAMGVSGILAVLVTVALAAPIGFFLTAFAGVICCGFLLNQVRTRSKLVEVGGACALTLGASAVAMGLLRMDAVGYTLVQGAYAALAGLGSGFVVLGVLPFIERAFHITTGMTLLEYQNHPLLRRLALEAPGTYNHSLQVGSMAEDAAAAIGADGLLCRVAAYYHDVGKLRKPDYFIENQTPGENRHLNLNPSVSLLVIVGHVKDGVEMAKEYGLPRAFVPIIQQHHGTTLVEYFYREACQRQQQKLAEGCPEAAKPIEACDYRYLGPKPRSREAAIVMMCDTCESACRAMTDPTPSRIEARVADLFQKRLLDGQFDECPLTLKELDLVRRSIVKSLSGIYHGRIQYPEQPHAAPDAPTVHAPVPAPLTQVG